MATFLQILIATVLVIGLLIVAAGWWLKRKIAGSMQAYSVAADLLGDALWPARIQLARTEQAELSQPANQLDQQLRELGFQWMADFEEQNCAFAQFRAYCHRQLRLGATVGQRGEDDGFFVLFTVSKDKQLAALGSGPGNSIEAQSIAWEIDPSLNPELALDRIRRSLTDDNLTVDVRLTKAVWEQAYAVGADQRIARPPRREDIERLAAEKNLSSDSQAIDQAYQMARSHWLEQIEEAVLDRYRRSSKIDAVTWEEQRDEIHVVHAHLKAEEIGDMLWWDESGESLVDQFDQQGLEGLDLYEAINQQLPSHQQRKLLAEIKQPVAAKLFLPDDDTAASTRRSGQYLYEARDANGRAVQSTVTATDAADAKQQIQALGLAESRLIQEPMPLDGSTEVVLAKADAKIAVRAARESIAMSLLRAVAANWWIWLPPAVLLGLSLAEGPTFTWGDYAVFAYAGLALLALLFFIAPMLLYHQHLAATLKANHRYARWCLTLLRPLDAFNALGSDQIIVEECKVLAAEGKIEQALADLNGIRNQTSEEFYQQALTQIYGNSGDWDALIQAQRAYLEVVPQKETARADLALSLARYQADFDEAQSLISALSPSELPEITVVGYQFVRGLIAAGRDQHQQALQHYQQALSTITEFTSNPIAAGLAAEINGYAAISLKKTGQSSSATELWQQVSPLLKLHRSGQVIVRAFAEA